LYGGNSYKRLVAIISSIRSTLAITSLSILSAGHPPNRIRRVLIKIDPTRQSNRIRRGESSDVRIIEPERVVVQSRFAIQVLALETKVLLFDVVRLAGFFEGVAPYAVARLPIDVSF
jgi:hypothetical protein